MKNGGGRYSVGTNSNSISYANDTSTRILLRRPSEKEKPSINNRPMLHNIRRYKHYLGTLGLLP